MMNRWKAWRERNYALEVVDHCLKHHHRIKDLLSPRQSTEFLQEIQTVQNAVTSQDSLLERKLKKLIALFERMFPQNNTSSLRENVEVILVAIIVAMAIRAYFFQPFKIPTGSMQPTLNGVILLDPTPVDRSWIYRPINRLLMGREYIRLTAAESGEFNPGSVKSVQFAPLHYGGKNGFLSFLPSDATQFEVGNHTYELPINIDKFAQEIMPDLYRRGSFNKGDTLFEKVIQTGDQLFVDRFTYHFRKPQRGDVFVFETQGLSYSNRPLKGDFYIKRLAGIPGDSLQIKGHDLWVNGSKIDHPEGFLRVMSAQNGYEGYTSQLNGESPPVSLSEPYTIPEKCFFALGDNSYHSLDSRFWGTVPHENLVGRGFFVYWPFTRHFGIIN